MIRRKSRRGDSEPRPWLDFTVRLGPWAKSRLTRSLLGFAAAAALGCGEQAVPTNQAVSVPGVNLEGKPVPGVATNQQAPVPVTKATRPNQASQPEFDTTRMTLKVVSPDPNVASRAYNVGDRIFFAFELTSDLPDEKHATVGYNLMLNRVTYDSQWLKKMDLPLPKGTSRYEGERIVKSNWKPGKYQLEPMAFATEFFPPEPGQTLPRSVNYKPLVKPVEIVINDPKKKPAR